MIKTSKLSHKSHKSSKDSSLRKSLLSKKTMRSRSPVRHAGSSRPPPMKRISPGMKRGPPIPKRKSPHSPRLRSIASSPHRSLSHRSKSPIPIDRAHAMKSLKYDKRKHLSNSPVRHLDSSPPRRPVLSHEPRELSPYLAERYPTTSAIRRSPQYSPIRKKTRRSASVSPPRRHAPVPHHSDGHIPRRAEHVSSLMHPKHHRDIPVVHEDGRKHDYDIRTKHHASPPPMMSSSRTKSASLKAPYPGENSRYRSASPVNRYPPPVLAGTKPYAPTLHERFSSVIESSRTEPRIRYSREDLEKITIDFNVRDPSPLPPPRHVVNPADMKLVRRAGEGHRPIFDREEIKHAARDMREEAYYERKPSTYGPSHPIDLREVENYQITRHRFDGHQDVIPSTSGRSLSDRWPAQDLRKNSVSLDRDEREKEYARIPPRNYVEARSRSRSGDRDFRPERYIHSKPPTHRDEYLKGPPSPELRNINYPSRKSSLPVDARHKLNFRKSERETPTLRSEPKGHYLPPDRHYDDMHLSRVERRDHHSPIPKPHYYKPRSPSRERLPDYPYRPEKYDYKSYPGIPSREPNYFEHEVREPPLSFRGSSRPPFRSPRGFRSRGFRGPIRGGPFRGSFRGGYRSTTSPRGRGIPRR